MESSTHNYLIFIQMNATVVQTTYTAAHLRYLKNELEG